jgi:hypothetical protein
MQKCAVENPFVLRPSFFYWQLDRSDVSHSPSQVWALLPLRAMIFDRVFMGLRPTHGDENRESSASLYATLLFTHATAFRIVIPTEAYPDFPLAAPKRSTCAAFLKEGRKRFASAKKFNRKSGVA